MDFHLAERLQYLIVLVLSLTVHEFFHAWTAWRLGDDTAARMGRLTLNPIPHIDPIGTILLPLLGVPIGWAKPVPVNPANFRRGVRMSTGDLLVSIAGPLSNLGFAVVGALVLGVLLRFAPDLVGPESAGERFLSVLIVMNVGLAIFNLLPLPPLDGSHVLGTFIPARWRGGWEMFLRAGPVLLMLLLVSSSFGGRSFLGAVLEPPRALLLGLLERLVNSFA